MTEIAKDRPAKNQVPEIPLKKLRQLWGTQRTTEDIAVVLRISLPYLHMLARRHSLPARTHVRQQRQRVIEIDPTPEEIVARAAECRARWSDADYNRSCGYKPRPVELQSYSFDGRFVAFTEIRRDA
jgi:hypothetical protein